MRRLRQTVGLLKVTLLPPSHAPRNCGDCGFEGRLCTGHNGAPSHAPRNCGYCGAADAAERDRVLTRLTPPGIAATAATTRPRRHPRCLETVSRPPELRRLRPTGSNWARRLSIRLTPPGIAATAAAVHVGRHWRDQAVSRPPELRRLRPTTALSACNCASIRLTPPGIAATAAIGRTVIHLRANRPSHAPRNCGDCGTFRHRVGFVPTPSHAPRKWGDCGGSGRAYLNRRLRPSHAPRNCGDCGRRSAKPTHALFTRLTPPGIAATAAV